MHNMHGVKPITAEHWPTAKPAELHIFCETCAILKDFQASAKRLLDLKSWVLAEKNRTIDPQYKLLS